MELINQARAVQVYDETLKQATIAPHFGYSALDNLIPGLLPGSLTVLAAQTSQGKTTLAANFAYHFAKASHQVLFASLESGVSPSKVVDNLAGGRELGGQINYLAPNKLLDISSLFALVEEKIHLCSVLIIDHLHYLSNSNTNNYSGHIGDLVRQIGSHGKRLGIPIILIAHTRKLPDNQIPGMADLRDSSFLSQDPDTVLILHRHKLQPNEVVGDESLFSNHGLLVVAKNRQFGRTGTIPVEFDPLKLSFSLGGQWPR